MAVHFRLELRIGLGLGVGALEIEDQRHQGLGDEAAAIDAEMPALVGTGAEGIGLLLDAHTMDAFDRSSGASAVARGADEGADPAGILLARRALDAGGDIDAGRAGDGDRLDDIARIEAAGQHPGHARVDALEQGPVEGVAEAAGTRGVGRRAGVEQQPVGDLGIGADRGQVGAAGDRQRLHDRQAEAGAHGDDAVRRLLAVQLQHVGLQRGDDGGDEIVIGVDGERDLAGAPRTCAPSGRAASSRKIARARRKEHEADEVGPGLERHFQRVGPAQPADFDRQCHGGARSSALSPAPQSASVHETGGATAGRLARTAASRRASSSAARRRMASSS